MANLIELQAISKTYNAGKPNAIKVLDQIDLAVEVGEVLGLIAPSGSGKSTLLNIAGLLDSPDSGKLIFNGADLTNADDHKRTKTRQSEIGFVFQFHHLLHEFSALENVMMPLLGAGVKQAEAKSRAEELLIEIGLKDRMRHRPSALSGGEAQRTAICRALAPKPKLLLADEPTGNLDPENAQNVFELLIRLARDEGMAAIVATHNHELAGRMNRIVDLNELQRANSLPA